MKRTSTALLAALEALVGAAVGIGIALVPLTLLWAVEFGIETPFEFIWRATGVVWLLGHGVDVVMRLDPATAAAVGVPGAGDPFPVTIAVLGFALLTVVVGRRIGVRAAGVGHVYLAAVAAAIVTGAVAWGVTVTASSSAAAPVVWQGVVLPVLVLLTGYALGAGVESARLGAFDGAVARPSTLVDEPAARAAREEPALSPGPIVRALGRAPAELLAVVRAAFAGGAAAAAGIVGVGALVVTVLIVADYATIAGLYQALQAGVVGGIALTVAELALLPNAVIWAVSWLLGPGFSFGAGTAVSPGGTLLGPVPGLPLLGIVPSDGTAFGFLGLIAPIALGFLAGYFVFRRRARTGEPWWMPVTAGIGIGIVGGAIIGILAAASAGAIGPGRLAVVGPDALAVGAVAALAIGVPAILGCGAAHRAYGREFELLADAREPDPHAEQVRVP